MFCKIAFETINIFFSVLVLFRGHSHENYSNPIKYLHIKQKYQTTSPIDVHFFAVTISVIISVYYFSTVTTKLTDLFKAKMV